jgi:hypothetical protein
VRVYLERAHAQHLSDAYHHTMAESHGGPSDQGDMNSIDSTEYERLARSFYENSENDEGSNGGTRFGLGMFFPLTARLPG